MLEFAKDLDRMRRVSLAGEDVEVVKLWCDVLSSGGLYGKVVDRSVAMLVEHIVLDYADRYLYPLRLGCLGGLSVRRGNRYVGFTAVVSVGDESVCLFTKDGRALCKQGFSARELASVVRKISDLLFTALIVLLDTNAVDEEKIDEVTRYASFLAERGAAIEPNLHELLVDVVIRASEKVYDVGLGEEEIIRLFTTISRAVLTAKSEDGWYRVLDDSGRYAGVMMYRFLSCTNKYTALLYLELTKSANIVIELNFGKGITPWLSVKLIVDDYEIAVKGRHWEVVEALRGLADWRRWALERLRSVLGYARSEVEAEAIKAWIRILESVRVENS